MSTPAKANYRLDIVGLRALAVTAVVGYHFGLPGFRGGFIGVDVFFVISGYLMTQILMRSLARDDFLPWQFYLARARRIVPALLVLCVVVLGLGAFWLVPPDYKELASQTSGSALFVSNFDFLRQFGYFDAADHQPWLLHTWSLSVEWQFYLLYPLLFMALRRLVPATGALRRVIEAAFVLSLAMCIVVTPHRPSFSFYMIFTRGWELLGGACVWFWQTRLTPSGRAAAYTAGIGVTLLVTSDLVFTSTTRWPGYWALLPVAGTMIILLARHETSALLTNRVARFLGNSSYSIYLWHWPVVVALDHRELSGSALWIAAGIAGAVVVGWLSYRFVETPGRRILGRYRPTTALAGFVAMAATVAAISVFVDISDGLPGRDNMRPYAQLADEVRAPEFADGSCVANERTMGLIDAGKYIDCVTGAPIARHTILLWGDSHAGHYAPMMAVLAKDANIRLKVFSTPECRPVLQSTPAYILGINPAVCLKFQAALRSSIRDYEYIVVAALWASTTSDPLVMAEFDDTLGQLQTAGARVVVLAQVPAYDKDVAKLYLYSKLFGYAMPERMVPNGEAAQANRQLRELIKKYPNTVLVDPTTFLCQDGSLSCDVMLDGQILYSDYTHLSLEGSMALGNALVARHANFLTGLK